MRSCWPILERSGLKLDADFDLAFSPERIDPGNTQFNAVNTPKVVGGVNARATQRAADLLSASARQSRSCRARARRR